MQSEGIILENAVLIESGSKSEVLVFSICKTDFIFSISLLSRIGAIYWGCYKYDDNTQLTAHFNAHEFKCGQFHDYKLSDELITQLDNELLRRYGVKFGIYKKAFSKNSFSRLTRFRE